MKNLSLVLNIILIVAVVILFALRFSDKKGAKQEPKETKPIDTAIVVPAGAKIVYVNVDSLLLQYSYYDELKNKLLDKQKSMEAEFNRKTADFEKEYTNFQKKVQSNSFLSAESAKMQEQELYEQQQKLMQSRDEYTQKLAEEESVMNKQLHDSIVNFIKIYNKDYNYQFVLSNTFGGALLYGDKSFDITGAIVTALNDRYKSNKKDAAKK